MIRVDQVWLARRPLDMRAGIDTLLGRVVETFGEARLHQAYLFANRPATRMKVLVLSLIHILTLPTSDLV